MTSSALAGPATARIGSPVGDRACGRTATHRTTRHPPSVQMNLLLDVADLVETVGDVAAVDVQGVEHDSRRVRAGDLFFCLPGRETDGSLHAAEAVRRGAVALVCEQRIASLGRTGRTGRTGLPGDPARSGTDGGEVVAQAVVGAGRARPAMARAAAELWGHPSRHLLMAGITGTNGKTTVTHLLGAVLEAAGHPTTVIGTLTGSRTTPESNELQRLLASVRDRASGARPAVAMEVSSHALVQSRVDGICYDVAVFTNLSQDHLDFHGTMESYFEAKASLFTPERAVRGVVGTGDSWGRRLLDEARIPMTAVPPDAVSDVRLEPGRSSFVWRAHRVDVAVTGMIGVRNAALAAEAAIALGVEPPDVVAGLGAAAPVPGRLEAIALPGQGGPPFTVLVDFAHTPAALDAVLSEARRLAGGSGRVLVVFGCGGERDRGKRPLMGQVAARAADVVVVTSDNPRREDPEAIIDEIVGTAASGIAASLGTRRFHRDVDRRSAIETAVGLAEPGDVVVVAGKGHETVQELRGQSLPFDDREVVAEILGRHRPSGHDPRVPGGTAPQARSV